MTEQLVAGERVGKFVVTRLLGSGGMGTVYEARDPELSRAVAIKLVRDRSSDPIRLLREAQALARISHPNVVGVHELGSHADDVFVAMELVDGVTLDQYLAENPKTWREVLALFVQAGRGLAAVHEQGLVHRDVKPSNVLVDREGRVRVGDFGLARRDDGPDSSSGSDLTSDDDRANRANAVTVDATPATANTTPATAVSDAPRDRAALDAQITAHGTVLGTPRYMAPEQLAGTRVTRSADQYAFAIALWEALYGEVPSRELRVVPPGSDVPAWLEKILARALALEPAARWPSMTVMLDAIERAPRRRTRIALFAIGAVAVAGTAILVAMAVRDRGTVACERAGDPVALAWNEVSNVRIFAAFTGFGAAWSSSSRTAIDNLDRWAARSRVARIDACRDTHERGTQSTALLDQRVSCLDGQQAVFAALVEAIVRADRSVAEHALAAIEQLPAPETCTAARLVGASADTRASADAIAEATVAVELQRSDARPVTAELVSTSRTAGPAVRARAHLLHGRAVAATEPKLARDELAVALGAAAESHDPGLEAEVLLATLVIAATSESADRIDALLPVARAAVTRAGEPRPLLRDLARAEVGVHSRLGRAEPAREACARAVALEDAPRVPFATADCECRISLVLRERKAASSCKEALALGRTLYGEIHPRVADLAYHWITALVRLGGSEEAETASRANVALLATLYGRESLQTVEGMELLSVTQDRLDKVAASRATLEEALAISDRVNPDAAERGGLLIELADRALQQKDRAAIQFADSGLAASEKQLGTEHRDLAVVLITHAKAVALDPAQMPRARESWRRAIAITEKNAGPKSYTMASVLSSYAYFLAERDFSAEALEPAQRSLPIFIEVGDPVAVARNEGLLGDILLDLKRPAEARPWYEKAHAHFVALGAQYADELAETDAAMAKTR